MRTRRLFSVIAASLAVLVAVGITANSAQAALSVSISMKDLTNGGTTYNQAPTAINSGDEFATGSQTVGVFSARVSTTPFELASFSDLNTTNFDINLTGAANTPSQLEIFVTVQGYQLPAGSNLILSSSASGTSSSGINGQVVQLQSYVDPANGNLAATPHTPGTHTGFLVGTAPPAKSYNFGVTNNLETTFSRSGPYSLTQRFLITLEPGNNASLTLTTAVTPIPEPGTMAMAALALPLLGLAAIRRRRKQI